MKKLLAVLVGLLMIAGALSAQEFSLYDVKDANLKLALRTIPSTNYSTLTNLRLNGSHIADISQLGKLLLLTKLDLYNNDIKDISALGNLINLTRLNIGKNKISDLKPLTNLVNLSSLDIQKNKVKDITPLRELANLKELDIRGVDINMESFGAWKFTDTLAIYDRNGVFKEIKADEKAKWGLEDGLVVPAYTK